MWNRPCLVFFFSNSSDVNLNTVPDWWIDVSQFSYYCCCAYGTSMFVRGHSCTYRTSDASSQGRVGGWWWVLKALLVLMDWLIFLSRFVACGCRWHWWGVTWTYIQVLLNAACWVSFYLQSDFHWLDWLVQHVSGTKHTHFHSSRYLRERKRLLSVCTSVRQTQSSSDRLVNEQTYSMIQKKIQNKKSLRKNSKVNKIQTVNFLNWCWMLLMTGKRRKSIQATSTNTLMSLVATTDPIYDLRFIYCIPTFNITVR